MRMCEHHGFIKHDFNLSLITRKIFQDLNVLWVIVIIIVVIFQTSVSAF